MHILIPISDPTLRILLHRSDSGAPFVTVEVSELDAVGAPQWKLRDDSRTEKVLMGAAVALIERFRPAAIASGVPTALGTCEYNGNRYRCTVSCDDGMIRLATEMEIADMAGAPRWDLVSRTTLTEPNGVARMDLIDIDCLLGCVYPR